MPAEDLSEVSNPPRNYSDAKTVAELCP